MNPELHVQIQIRKLSVQVKSEHDWWESHRKLPLHVSPTSAPWREEAFGGN